MFQRPFTLTVQQSLLTTLFTFPLGCVHKTTKEIETRSGDRMLQRKTDKARHDLGRWKVNGWNANKKKWVEKRQKIQGTHRCESTKSYITFSFNYESSSVLVHRWWRLERHKISKMTSNYPNFILLSPWIHTVIIWKYQSKCKYKQ